MMMGRVFNRAPPLDADSDDGVVGELAALKRRFVNAREFHQVVLHPNFQRCIPVHRDGDSGNAADPRIDVMAPIDTLQFPAVRFEQAAELFPTYGFQTVISTTVSLGAISVSRRSTERQPSTASWIF